MKKVYLIGGTMGVGKTTVSQYLKNVLPKAVFLDGDWCWDADPFIVTDETKKMVVDNLCYMLNNFIKCSAYENIVFCWVMHKQDIIDEIVDRLDTAKCSVNVVSLVATADTLTKRIMCDVNNGIRTIDVLERSISRLPLYQVLDSIKINTDDKSIKEVGDEIRKL